MGSGAVWLAAGLAIVTSAALSAVLAWCGPIDRPRDRGLSTAPTPTAGGLAIMGGMLVALLASLPALRADGAGPPFTAACAVALAHGLLGALDDVVDFGARTKLLAQLIMAFGFAVLVHPARMPLGGALAIDLPWPIAVGGVALWIIVVTNAVNFMDGSNGLIAGALAIVLGGLGLRALGGEDAGAGLGLMAASGACLGFLPWNFPKATLFQGDAGALFLGALVAALAVVAAGGGRPDADLNLLAAPIALTPLLTDVLLTLIARLRRAQRLTEAHRDHLYQRWLVAHRRRPYRPGPPRLGDHGRLHLAGGQRRRGRSDAGVGGAHGRRGRGGGRLAVAGPAGQRLRSPVQLRFAQRVSRGRPELDGSGPALSRSELFPSLVRPALPGLWSVAPGRLRQQESVPKVLPQGSDAMQIGMIGLPKRGRLRGNTDQQSSARPGKGAQALSTHSIIGTLQECSVIMSPPAEGSVS